MKEITSPQGHGHFTNAEHREVKLVSYEDFAKLDIRIGTIKEVERIPNTDKLLKCTVDFGEEGIRMIVSGIAEWKEPALMVGKQCPYIINLAPRMLCGVESSGMLLAIFDDSGIAFLHPERDMPPGTSVS